MTDKVKNAFAKRVISEKELKDIQKEKIELMSNIQKSWKRMQYMVRQLADPSYILFRDRAE